MTGYIGRIESSCVGIAPNPATATLHTDAANVNAFQAFPIPDDAKNPPERKWPIKITEENHRGKSPKPMTEGYDRGK